MKKGISRWAFPADMPLREVFEKAAKAGFDGVEVTMDPSGELSLDTQDDELRRIRKTAIDCKTELYSVAGGVYWDASLVSDDEAERLRARDFVKKQLHIAKMLGCDTVLVIPGHTGVDFAPQLGVVDYESAYERAVTAAKELAPFAEEAGITIGMENVWNKFLQSPREMRSFIDEIGSPNVQSYFDVGNTMQCGYPAHWINILGKRIKAVHFKDFKCSIGNLNGFCELLDGDVNFCEVMNALDKIGYDGWITSEVFPGDEDLDGFLRRTSASMDKIMKREV